MGFLLFLAGNFELAELFVSNGANPWFRDRQGRSPADLAAQHGNVELERYLSDIKQVFPANERLVRNPWDPLNSPPPSNNLSASAASHNTSPTGTRSVESPSRQTPALCWGKASSVPFPTSFPLTYMLTGSTKSPVEVLLPVCHLVT